MKTIIRTQSFKCIRVKIWWHLKVQTYFWVHLEILLQSTRATIPNYPTFSTPAFQSTNWISKISCYTECNSSAFYGSSIRIHRNHRLKFQLHDSIKMLDRDRTSVSGFASTIPRDDRQYRLVTRIAYKHFQYRYNGATCACMQADSSICCSPGSQRCSLLPGPTPTPPTFTFKRFSPTFSLHHSRP